MRYARLEPLDLDVDALREAHIAVVGAGATGSRMLAQLARCGTDLTVIDRDYLEAQNLATSALYTESQVASRLPKAVAAAEQLRAVNDAVRVETAVADLNRRTVDSLLDGADIVLDGTDNMETRHLINEWSLTHDVPWVHVAAVAQRGQVMPVVPGETRCYNCVFGDIDGAALPTCETAGIAPAAAATAASVGVSAVFDVLNSDVDTGLTRFELGSSRFDRFDIRDSGCSTCREGATPYLDGDRTTTAAKVCGEDQFQVNPATGDVDLAAVADELRERGDVMRNDHLLRFEGETEFTLFEDGRMIVAAESREAAKNAYNRFIGS